MARIFSKAMLYRDGKLFIKALVYAIVLTVVFGLACFAAAYTALNYTESGEAPLSFAFSDGQNTFFSRVIMNMVSGNENISKFAAIKTVSEAEAESGVKNGTYVGGVILPKGWLDAIMTGQKASGRVYIGSAIENQGALAAHAINVGERLIAAGQYGVFASSSAVRKSYPEHYDSFLLSANDAMINASMSGMDKYFYSTLLPYGGTTLTLKNHYAALILAALCEMCTLFFIGAACADMKMAERLLAAGVTRTQFIASKILYAFIYRVVILVPSLIIFGADFASILLALFGALLLSALGIFVSILLSGSRYSAAVLSAASAVSLFLCGAVVPLGMMPDAVGIIGSFTPMGAMYQALAPAFGGSCSVASIAFLAALCIALAPVCSKRIVGGEAL